MPLYVVATPVGNLEDITRRAARVLSEVELVLAEDTRHTRPLLSALGIEAPLAAYHDHTDAARRAGYVRRLAEGASFALVSDAGTPCVSDPGYELVRDAIEAGVDVVPVPGASALLAFVVGAGLPSDTFAFVGFAPRKSGARDAAVEAWSASPRTTIAYESAKRIVDLCERLALHAPDRAVAVGRELTKRYEEFVRGNAREVHAELAARESLRGEVVIGVGPAPATEGSDDEVDAWLETLLGEGLGTKAAARAISKRLGRRTQDVYERALRLKE